MLGRGVAVVDWSLALDMDVGDPHEESFHLSCPLQSASVLLAMARHRLQCVRLPEPVFCTRRRPWRSGESLES